MRATGLLLLVGSTTLAWACGPGGEARDTGSEQARAAGDEVADQVGAGPTLLALMRQLEVDMQRIDRGLWAGRADSVAAAARAVADHPQVGPEERARIMGILGPRGADFAAADRRVHDAAVAVAEAAEDGGVPAAVQALPPLQVGCVACHQTFREEVRSTRAGP